jgi:hypothetical protein
VMSMAGTVVDTREGHEVGYRHLHRC